MNSIDARHHKKECLSFRRTKQFLKEKGYFQKHDGHIISDMIKVLAENTYERKASGCAGVNEQINHFINETLKTMNLLPDAQRGIESCGSNTVSKYDAIDSANNFIAACNAEDKSKNSQNSTSNGESDLADVEIVAKYSENEAHFEVTVIPKDADEKEEHRKFSRSFSEKVFSEKVNSMNRTRGIFSPTSTSGRALMSISELGESSAKLNSYDHSFRKKIGWKVTETNDSPLFSFNERDYENDEDSCSDQSSSSGLATWPFNIESSVSNSEILHTPQIIFARSCQNKDLSMIPEERSFDALYSSDDFQSITWQFSVEGNFSNSQMFYNPQIAEDKPCQMGDLFTITEERSSDILHSIDLSSYGSHYNEDFEWKIKKSAESPVVTFTKRYSSLIKRDYSECKSCYNGSISSFSEYS